MISNGQILSSMRIIDWEPDWIQMSHASVAIRSSGVLQLQKKILGNHQVTVGGVSQFHKKILANHQVAVSHFCRDGGFLPPGDRSSLSCWWNYYLQSFSCQQCCYSAGTYQLDITFCNKFCDLNRSSGSCLGFCQSSLLLYRVWQQGNERSVSNVTMVLNPGGKCNQR